MMPNTPAAQHRHGTVQHMCSLLHLCLLHFLCSAGCLWYQLRTGQLLPLLVAHQTEARPHGHHWPRMLHA
jgi:hypothetical protein